MSKAGYRERCLAQKLNTCNVCGDAENLIVHHLNGDKSDNRLENLTPVCRSCHAVIHHGESDNPAIKRLSGLLPEDSFIAKSTKGRERDEDSGKFTEAYPPESFIETIREHGGMASTPELTDVLGCSNRLALNRLRALEDEDRVDSRKVGNAYLWMVDDD